MEALETRLDETQRIATLRRPIVSVGGYVDFGFFVPQGTGVGVIQDEGPNRYFPQYANRYGWVFLGDLLAPAVNTRGEPASLGNFPGVNRFDSINSDGAPSFIVNEVNLTLNAALARNALATASVDFIPRSGQEFSIGDFMEVDIAQLEWMPTASGRTSIFVGKFDSVIGIEYRDRKSTQRFGITPSLIARYSTGTPLGIKVRSKFGDDERVVIAAAITNGSSSIEQFHFYDEIDSNSGKTISGRVSVRPFPLDLQVGLSGSWGPQDHAIDNTNAMWFVGVDLLAHLGRLDIKGQWLKGRAPGETGPVYDPNHRPYGLDLHSGAYLELDWMVTPMIRLPGARRRARRRRLAGEPERPDRRRSPLHHALLAGHGAGCGWWSTSTSSPRRSIFAMESTTASRRYPTTSSRHRWSSPTEASRSHERHQLPANPGRGGRRGGVAIVAAGASRTAAAGRGEISRPPPPTSPVWSARWPTSAR